jgi:hypothetical protein
MAAAPPGGVDLLLSRALCAAVVKSRREAKSKLLSQKVRV